MRFKPPGRSLRIGDAAEEWHVKNDRFRCYHNHYEKVGAQKVAEDLERERNWSQIGVRGPVCRRCGQDHFRIEPIGVVPPGGKSKEERIRMFAQAPFQEGRVYIYEGMIKLKEQILAFPHGDLVDEFDAFAYLINLLRPPMSDEDLAEMEEQEDLRKHTAKQRIETGERVYGGYV